MPSKNQLLGHGAPETETEEVKETGDLKLYRHDCPEGRVFPADMVAMMKYKKWVEKPVVAELSDPPQTGFSLSGLGDDPVKESKIDLSEKDED